MIYSEEGFEEEQMSELDCESVSDLIAEVKRLRALFEETNHHLDLMVERFGVEALVEMVGDELTKYDLQEIGPCNICKGLPKGSGQKDVDELEKHGIIGILSDRSDDNNTGCEGDTPDVCVTKYICDYCRFNSGQWAIVYSPSIVNGIRSAAHSDEYFGEMCLGCYEELKKNRPDLAAGNWGDEEQVVV